MFIDGPELYDAIYHFKNYPRECDRLHGLISQFVKDIHAHHCSELAELEMEQSRIWRALDASKADDVYATSTAMAALNRIHVRRARLLGLDAPQKLDVRACTAPARTRCQPTALLRALASLLVAEQIRWYETFAEAQKQLNNAPVEPTGTVINGTEQRNDPDEDGEPEE